MRIEYNPEFNPNVYCYFIYRDFLAKSLDPIQGVFVTVISDFTLAQNPFNDPLYQDNSKTLFCGDEPTLLDNEWMLAHTTHLREQMADYHAYEEQFAKESLLNCGIIGGSFSAFFDFLKQLCEIYETYNRANKTAYADDMGAFNYLA